MSLSMKLWQVDGDELKPVPRSILNREARLEAWLRKDPGLVGMDVLFIGQQISVTSGARIDLLAMDSEANLVIFELKRDRTPRDVVAQALDYGSFVSKFTYDDIDKIAIKSLDRSIADAYREYFGQPIPDKVNQSHQMIVLASELDEASERIVTYLADEHNVPINAIFFTFFKTEQGEFLGRAWLKDPEEVQEKAVSKKQSPWTGYYFVNVGEGEHRNWDDCRRYGFISAGQGTKYSRPLSKLKEGDQVFAYMKGLGYVGFGTVSKPTIQASEFEVESEGKALKELPLSQPNIFANSDDPEMAEWVVGIDWKQTFTREAAKWFNGGFANQNIVCKLRSSETLSFLRDEFGVD